jgi:hypothetical protein
VDISEHRTHFNSPVVMCVDLSFPSSDTERVGDHGKQRLSADPMCRWALAGRSSDEHGAERFDHRTRSATRGWALAVSVGPKSRKGLPRQVAARA